jgi:hypothetical protein
MGDIGELCENYAFVGYMIRFLEEIKKKEDRQQSQRVFNDPLFIGLREKIQKRVNDLLSSYCEKCNTQINPKENFCSNCGNKIKKTPREKEINSLLS